MNSTTNKVYLRVLWLVCAEIGADYTAAERRARGRLEVLARHITYYLLKKVCGWSLPQVSRAIGCRNSSMVYAGADRVRDVISMEPWIARCVARVERHMISEGGAWNDASTKSPDADLLVLTVYAPSDHYHLACFSGENFCDPETMEPVRVTHWQDLPEAPR